MAVRACFVTEDTPPCPPLYKGGMGVSILVVASRSDAASGGGRRNRRGIVSPAEVGAPRNRPSRVHRIRPVFGEGWAKGREMGDKHFWTALGQLV